MTSKVFSVTENAVFSPSWRAVYFTVMASNVFHRHGERSVAIQHHAIDDTLTADPATPLDCRVASSSQ
jgi:hypothetical protein